MASLAGKLASQNELWRRTKLAQKSAAERKREQRAREKTNTGVTTSHDENLSVTQCHEASRNVTTEERRGDTEKNTISWRSR